MKKINGSFKLKSISYLHDKGATQSWCDLYVEMIKEQLIKKAEIKIEQ